VLAKKPDAKWRRQIEDIERLGATQQAILKNAARLVKPGGVLVYSTCTIEPEENRMVIDAFLKDHPDFTLEPAPAFLHRDVVAPSGTIETFTHQHGMDGSFAARLRRSAS
jgi:16S rRNA (cytosine967-C5)-methyltransferase